MTPACVIPDPVIASVESTAKAVRQMHGLVEVLGTVNSIHRVDDYIYLVKRHGDEMSVTIAQLETSGGRRIAAMERAPFNTQRLQAA